MTRIATLSLVPLIALALAGCSDRGGDELMRRVAQAEEAATKAEAAARRAEAAAASVGAGSGSASETISPPPPETVTEDGPDIDPNYGEGEDPVPLDG